MNFSDNMKLLSMGSRNIEQKYAFWNSFCFLAELLMSFFPTGQSDAREGGRISCVYIGNLSGASQHQHQYNQLLIGGNGADDFDFQWKPVRQCWWAHYKVRFLLLERTRKQR